MSNLNLRGLYALIVAAAWMASMSSTVGASAAPDQADEVVTPASSGQPPESGESAATTAESNGPDTPLAEADKGVAAQKPGGLHFPIDGIRPDTKVLGKVVGHPTGKLLLSVHDVVTLKMDGSLVVKPHALFGIARREQFVEHPGSGRNMGYVVRVMAMVEMKEAFGRYWSAEIVSSTDYVTIDDWVIPFESTEAQTGEPPANVVGYVVSVRDELVLAGEANVVYTDLGSAQGVKSGDEFTVIRPGTSGRHGSPDRSVGSLRILEVQPASSSAYLTKTTEPVAIGDRLEHALVSSAVQ